VTRDTVERLELTPGSLVHVRAARAGHLDDGATSSASSSARVGPIGGGVG
jgi:hypothetical protein